jgi:hypothetical protein
MGDQFPFLVIARDYYSKFLGFTFRNGNMLPLDGGIPAVALPAYSTALGTETLRATNFPVASANPYVTFSEIADGLALNNGLSVVNADPDAGVGSASFAFHSGYPDSLQVEVGVQSNNETIATTNAIATQTAPPASSGTISVDFSTLLPAFATAAVDSSDPIRPSASWDVSAPLAAAAGVFVGIPWNHRGVDGGNPQNGSWTIIAPAGSSSTGQVKAPALPASSSAWLPWAGSTWPSIPTVAAIQADSAPSYTTLRKTAAQLAPVVLANNRPIGSVGATYGPTLPPLSANVTMRVTMIYPGAIVLPAR